MKTIEKKKGDVPRDFNSLQAVCPSHGGYNGYKQGQITIFIIIGLVLIIILGLTAYFSQTMYVKKLFLDKDLATVVTFTEQCIKDAADQGVFLLAMQGGYITLPEVLDKDPFASINNGFKVPFWFYRSRDYMPSTSQVEYQLVTFVNDQVASCINNFNAFRTTYDLSEIKGIQTSVVLLDKKVTITTEIPTTLKLKAATTFKKMPPVVVDVKTSMGSMFNLGRSIMAAENEQAFLEELTDDMIAVSPSVPYTGMELTCEPRSWTVDQLEEHIKNLILYNMRYLHFEGTQYVKTGIPYYEKQYNYKVTQKTSKYNDLLVNVIYDPAWNFELEVSPSKNGMVKPIEYTASELLFTCFKMYNHHYTYTYPIMFQIINTKNPEENFYFATPVVVKRNLPNRYNEVSVWSSELQGETNAAYCDQGTEEITQYSVDSQGNIQTKPSNISLRKNQLSVFVYDTAAISEKNLLQGVNLSYQCVNFRCPMGSTDYPRVGGKLTGAEPMLTTLFPDCENGLIIAEKEGYLTTYQQQSVNPQTNNFNVVMNMKRVKPFNIKVKVIEDKNGFIQERDLKQDEHVFIRVENKELSYEQQFVHPSELTSTVPLALDVVNYDLDIKLFNEERLLGGAELSWIPDLEQLQYRGGVMFYVYLKDVPVYEHDVKKQKQAFEFAIEESKKYAPRLTLS
ncbi:hypothetical protein HYY69_01280 [Candidatus Woesearchaeota archaeon]|nr:hypothetical protein [Candidatus Woesearchaeota archaeon]